MNRREIKTIISRVEKLMTKRRKLIQESTAIELEGQKALNDMAKACSPYKKGQMFKKRGSVIWAKVTEVDATKMKYNRIDPAYLQAPYQLVCLRCDVKGKTQKDKWIFIDGNKIGSEWDVVED